MSQPFRSSLNIGHSGTLRRSDFSFTSAQAETLLFPLPKFFPDLDWFFFWTSFFCGISLKHNRSGQRVEYEEYLHVTESDKYRLMEECGGIVIADEVQVGFGRVGDHWWAFQQYESGTGNW